MGRRSKKKSDARQELEQMKEAHTALEDKLRRALADMANIRRRQSEEIQRATENAVGRIAQEMLPIMDSFHLALASEGGREALLDGVRLVHSMLEDLLGRHGIEPIPALDQTFDPTVHEALAVEPRGDVQPNTVVAVHQAGFKLGNRVLRPARVVVSQTPPSESADEAPAADSSDPQES